MLESRDVKRHAGGAGQMGAQNLDDRSHLAGGWLCFHKRPETHRQAEDRPIAGGPVESCPVDSPVGGLHQPAVGGLAVQCRRSCAASPACNLR
jgi:hypothetical protein